MNHKEKRKNLNLDKANWTEIKKGLIDLKTKKDLSNMPVQGLWSSFRSVLDASTAQHNPSKTVSGKYHIP